MDAALEDVLHWITRGIEIGGVAVIVIGIVAAFLRFCTETPQVPGSRFHTLRSRLGRSILLGLELLVAADIINTVAVEPTLRSVAVLAGIVLIRTFLSLSLEVEIDGKWPWQQGERRSSPNDQRR